MIPLRRGKIERIVYEHIVKKIRRDLVQFIARTVQHNGVKLAYFGKYAIVVPYPYAAENHQMDNAMWLASSGGARIVKDSDCTEENFNRIVLDWLREPDKYREMGAKLAEIAIPDASRRILNMIGNIVFVARAV